MSAAASPAIDTESRSSRLRARPIVTRSSESLSRHTSPAPTSTGTSAAESAPWWRSMEGHDARRKLRRRDTRPKDAAINDEKFSLSTSDTSIPAGTTIDDGSELDSRVDDMPREPTSHIWPGGVKTPIIDWSVVRPHSFSSFLLYLVTHPDVQPPTSCSDALESAWYRHLPAPQGLIGPENEEFLKYQYHVSQTPAQSPRSSVDDRMEAESVTVTATANDSTSHSTRSERKPKSLSRTFEHGQTQSNNTNDTGMVDDAMTDEDEPLVARTEPQSQPQSTANQYENINENLHTVLTNKFDTMIDSQRPFDQLTQSQSQSARLSKSSRRHVSNGSSKRQKHKRAKHHKRSSSSSRREREREHRSSRASSSTEDSISSDTDSEEERRRERKRKVRQREYRTNNDNGTANHNQGLDLLLATLAESSAEPVLSNGDEDERAMTVMAEEVLECDRSVPETDTSITTATFQAPSPSCNSRTLKPVTAIVISEQTPPPVQPRSPTNNERPPYHQHSPHPRSMHAATASALTPTTAPGTPLSLPMPAPVYAAPALVPAAYQPHDPPPSPSHQAKALSSPHYGYAFPQSYAIDPNQSAAAYPPPLGTTPYSVHSFPALYRQGAAPYSSPYPYPPYGPIPAEYGQPMYYDLSAHTAPSQLQTEYYMYMQQPIYQQIQQHPGSSQPMHPHQQYLFQQPSPAPQAPQHSVHLVQQLPPQHLPHHSLPAASAASILHSSQPLHQLHPAGPAPLSHLSLPMSQSQYHLQQEPAQTHRLPQHRLPAQPHSQSRAATAPPDPHHQFQHHPLLPSTPPEKDALHPHEHQQQHILQNQHQHQPSAAFTPTHVHTYSQVQLQQTHPTSLSQHAPFQSHALSQSNGNCSRAAADGRAAHVHHSPQPSQQPHVPHLPPHPRVPEHRRPPTPARSRAQKQTSTSTLSLFSSQHRKLESQVQKHDERHPQSHEQAQLSPQLQPPRAGAVAASVLQRVTAMQPVDRPIQATDTPVAASAAVSLSASFQLPPPMIVDTDRRDPLQFRDPAPPAVGGPNASLTTAPSAAVQFTPPRSQFPMPHSLAIEQEQDRREIAASARTPADATVITGGSDSGRGAEIAESQRMMNGHTEQLVGQSCQPQPQPQSQSQPRDRCRPVLAVAIGPSANPSLQSIAQPLPAMVTASGQSTPRESGDMPRLELHESGETEADRSARPRVEIEIVSEDESSERSRAVKNHNGQTHPPPAASHKPTPARNGIKQPANSAASTATNTHGNVTVTTYTNTVSTPRSIFTSYNPALDHRLMQPLMPLSPTPAGASMQKNPSDSSQRVKLLGNAVKRVYEKGAQRSQQRQQSAQHTSQSQSQPQQQPSPSRRSPRTQPQPPHTPPPPPPVHTQPPPPGSSILPPQPDATALSQPQPLPHPLYLASTYAADPNYGAAAYPSQAAAVPYGGHTYPSKPGYYAPAPSSFGGYNQAAPGYTVPYPGPQCEAQPSSGVAASHLSHASSAFAQLYAPSMSAAAPPGYPPVVGFGPASYGYDPYAAIVPTPMMYYAQ